MVIYVLLISMIALLVLSYVISKRDIFNPSCVVCASFVISVLACIFNIEYWGVDLRWDTFGYIAGGMLIFVLTAAFVETFAEKVTIKKQLADVVPSVSLSNYEPRREIQTPVVWIMIIVSVFVGFFFLREAFNVASIIGADMSDWNSIMAVFRHDQFATDRGMPMWMFRVHNFIVILAYPAVFCIIRDILEKRRVRVSMVVLLLVCVIISFFRGGRAHGILLIPAAAVITSAILWHRKHGWSQRIPLKVIGVTLLAFLGVLLIFYATSEFVGRETGLDLFRYITFYAGGNIMGMDLFLSSPPPTSDIWGRETFSGLITALGRILNNPEWQAIRYEMQGEFRFAPTGRNIGNTFPVFRLFLADFGFFGFVILTIITSAILTGLYISVRNRKSRDPLEMDFLTMFYVTCFSLSILTPPLTRTPLFFTNPAHLTNHVFLFFAVYVFERLRFSFNGELTAKSKYIKCGIRGIPKSEVKNESFRYLIN